MKVASTHNVCHTWYLFSVLNVVGLSDSEEECNAVTSRNIIVSGSFIKRQKPPQTLGPMTI